MMQKAVFFPLIFCVLLAEAQITKVEHFFISSPQAEKYFKLFNEQLGLPVVWNYQVWTGFASGGVTLGNVAFEFVYYDGVKDTRFDGIALEPKQSVQEFVKDLKRLNIPHDSISVNSTINQNGNLVGWDNLGLIGVLPSEANLFICDYKQRDRIADGRRKSMGELNKKGGGPLGVIALKEFVIHTTDIDTHKTMMAKLPGVISQTEHLFSFNEGPSIRLVASEKNGIERIVVRVKSLEQAKKHLQSINLLGTVHVNSVYMDKIAMEGLDIELVE